MRIRTMWRFAKAGYFARSAAAALLLACAPALAQLRAPDVTQVGPTRVIELFTSQGCPKCPPADRLIADLAKEPDTIALSFAVNYWDYIGWKDTLASPAFTARQHAYAAARGDRLIFTPQAIVGGRRAEPGADKAAILRDMRSLAERQGTKRVPISVAETGGSLQVHIGGGVEGAVRDPVGVYILRVARAKTVQIARGENSGRSVTYTNVVRAMNKLGDWSGSAVDFHMLELKGDDEGYVVLLQAGSPDKPGTILAAAKTGDL